MGQKPSVPTDLSRSLRVIGAGFSRTGTVSFSLALETLLKGPVCHSGSSVLLREEDYVQKWISIQQNDCEDDFIKDTLKDLTAGFVGITDIPSILYVGELVELYPDAIVICTTRDKDEWWKSLDATRKNASFWWLNALFWPMPTLRLFGKWRESVGVRIRKIYQSPTKLDKDLGPYFLEVHEDYIRRVVPPERLFFFSVKDGWEPLCKILNCPVPDEPFPRANDAKAMEEFFRAVVRKSTVTWLQFFVISGVAVGLGFWSWRQCR